MRLCLSVMTETCCPQEKPVPSLSAVSPPICHYILSSRNVCIRGSGVNRTKPRGSMYLGTSGVCFILCTSVWLLRSFIIGIWLLFPVVSPLLVLLVSSGEFLEVWECRLWLLNTVTLNQIRWRQRQVFCEYLLESGKQGSREDYPADDMGFASHVLTLFLKKVPKCCSEASIFVCDDGCPLPARGTRAQPFCCVSAGLPLPPVILKCLHLRFRCLEDKTPRVTVLGYLGNVLCTSVWPLRSFLVGVWLKFPIVCASSSCFGFSPNCAVGQQRRALQGMKM